LQKWRGQNSAFPRRHHHSSPTEHKPMGAANTPAHGPTRPKKKKKRKKLTKSKRRLAQPLIQGGVVKDQKGHKETE